MPLDIIFSIILFLCLLLTLVPTAPGILFMFIAVVIYGFIDSFTSITPWHLAVFGGITLLSILIDYSSGIIGAKLGGANKKSILFGFLGLIVGLIFFPPFGMILGLFTGIFLSELIQYKDHMRALKAASFSLAATLFGTGTNILLAIGFYITFLVVVF